MTIFDDTDTRPASSFFDDVPLTLTDMLVAHGVSRKRAKEFVHGKEQPKRSAKKLKTFKFHGAFKSKADAVAKEKEIDGAFIRHKNGRYYVIQRLT